MCGLVGLLLIGVELTLQWAGPRLSRDLKHIRAIPQIVAEAHEAPEPRILLLGNSLTRTNIDAGLLGRSLDVPASIAAVHPDDTTIADWYYLYKNRLSARPNPFVMVIVGFAEGQLTDTAVPNPKRLGRHFATWRDLGELSHGDIADFDSWAQFLLAKASFSFAESERVRHRVLSAVVPDYGRFANRLNDTQATALQTTQAGAGAYSRLRRFIRRVKADGVLPVFVAHPIGREYVIPKALSGLFRKEKVGWIDGRHQFGLAEDDFPDGYHLGDRGRRMFTAYLARQLEPLLAKAIAESSQN